jgi:hypothetical protein
LIIELLSPSTEKVDRTVKKDLYARVFRTKEYFLVDPDNLKVEGFELAGQTYLPKAPTPQGRVWSNQLRAYLGFWHGVWTDAEADWARLFRLDGSLMPTKAEAAEQKAEAAEQKAEAAEQKAEEERQKAETAEKRAEAERQKTAAERHRAEAAEAELARLRALLGERAGV